MTSRLMPPVLVLDHEWTAGARPIEAAARYTAARVLVRVHGTPVGCVVAPLSGGRCEGDQLEAAITRACGPAIVSHLVADALASPGGWPAEGLLHARHPEWTGPYPLVTVAICTRDRPQHLERCLESLRGLDYPNLDRLVVDNAPTSGATEELVRRHPEVRYVREPRPGLDWARNRAIAEARGDLIAFTDDDVSVDAGWVRALARAFVDPEVMAVTGLVVPAELETRAQVLFEDYGGFGRGYERRFHRVHVEAGERAARFHGGAGMFGTGANMAFRRELFERIGPFDPALDVGTAANGGGDLEMFFRTLKEGHTLVYEPAAVVRHWHRREYSALRTQIRNNGVGFHAYLVRAALAYPDERLTLLRLAQWWLRWWHVRRLLRSLVRPAEFPRDLILAEISGIVPGFVAYFRSRREAARLGAPPLRRRPASPREKRAAGVAVRHVDVADMRPSFADADRHRRARVLVTRGGAALADVELPLRGRPLSEARLRDAVARDIAWRAVERGSDPKAMAATLDARTRRPAALASDVSVSVVVATRNRPDDLRRCLQSLSAQAPARPIEIVVVDNDPESGLTPPVVAEFPTVRLVSERRQGLAYARNAGFAAGHGDVLVATDDDVTMPPEWLESLLAPFARREVGIVTGLVWPETLDAPAQRLFEAYGGLGRGLRPLEADAEWLRSFRVRAAPTWLLGATANAAFRASALREAGLMDEALGPGTPTGVGEDTDLFYRILAKGHTLVYEPRACVRHRHRTTRDALRRQIYGYSTGHVAYHLTTLLRYGDRRALARLFLELPLAHLLRAWQRVRWGCEYPLSLILLEVAGNLAGPWTLWRSRRRVRRLGRSEGLRERPAGAPRAAASASRPPISVVVCTRDRPDSLRDCLASLDRLRYPEFEVVVVDSASRDDATRRAVDGTGARYVRESRPGLNWARRRGAAEARHGIVAYADDDVRVHPGWLDGIGDAFADPSVALVTGLVLPAELETRAQRLFERYGGMGKGPEPRSFRAESMSTDARLAVHALGVGANMALRKDALVELGGFDTSLDVGTPARGGGDLDMFSRVLAAGLTVRYEPRARVWHRHRRDLDALHRQIHDNGVAFGVYLIHAWLAGRASGLAVARFGLWRWFGGYLLVRLVRGLAGREALPLSLLWAETRGALEAPFAYMAARRHDRRIRAVQPETGAAASSGAAS